MKLNGDLIIEVTRSCNMTCDHCLRGKAENKTISHKNMENTIKQFERISMITFTGGEPSLNPQAITDFIDICKSNGVSVGSFYIATNAKQASEQFLMAVFKLYQFCDDNEMSSLEISNDYFHENEPDIVELLQVFKFTRLKYTEPFNHEYKGKSNMINQGFYANNYGDGKEETEENFDYVEFDEETKDINFSEIHLYLNCDGKIIVGCDWSYENQKEHVLCNCNKSIYNALKQKLTLVNI